MDFRAVLDWLQVTLVRSAPSALFSMIMSETKNSLSNTVMLKHRHTVLICDLPGLDISMIQATVSLIITNIRELFSEQCSSRLEVEALRKHKEKYGGERLL